jgi:hypothetical protein
MSLQAFMTQAKALSHKDEEIDRLRAENEALRDRIERVLEEVRVNGMNDESEDELRALLGEKR